MEGYKKGNKKMGRYPGYQRSKSVHTVPLLGILEVCKIGKILYMHLYRKKWYSKVA
jgi:hypothetical protein